MKISVIGAGEIGKHALAALFRILPKDTEVDILLLNRNEKKAGAVYNDVSFEIDGLFLSEYKSVKTQLQCQVSSDPVDLKGSDVIIFTAGISATQIGSTNREAALPFVYRMVSDYALHIKEHAPESLILMITNPADISTWIMQEKTGFPPERVLGFGCELDSRRFIRVFRDGLQKIGLNPDKITADVIGGHSANTMIFPRSSIKLDGKDLSETIAELDKFKREEVEQVIKESEMETRDYGFRMISNGGRAYVEPVVFLAYAARSYLFGPEIHMSCSQVLQQGRGYCSIEESCLSVPVIIGQRTIEIDEEKYLLSTQELDNLSSVANTHKILFESIKSIPNTLIDEFEKALKELENQKIVLQMQINNIGRMPRLDDDTVKFFIGIITDIEYGFGTDKHSKFSIKIKDSIDVADEKKPQILSSIANYFEKTLDVKIEFDEHGSSFSAPRTAKVLEFIKSCNQNKQPQSRL